MQQRQLRLGDILDDYCPRERRVTNHAVVAMIGPEVKQTRCTTCDSEHEYKQAKMPRLRRKTQTPAALAAQGLAGAPKLHEHGLPVRDESPLESANEPPDDLEITGTLQAGEANEPTDSNDANEAGVDVGDDEGGPGQEGGDDRNREEGPVHRPLIRASLPRPEGQPPPARPATDFTIRQPTGRQNRFRQRFQQGGGQFQGNRGNGNFGGSGRGGASRQGGRPQQGGGAGPRHQRRNDSGRKRSR